MDIRRPEVLYENEVVGADTLYNQVPATAIPCAGKPVYLAGGNLYALPGFQRLHRTSPP
jgi:hypothetical protein